MQKREWRIPGVWIRRVTQAAFLLLFLFLFRKTDYTGEDTIPYAVNLFFRWDPLVGASATLAARQIVPLLLPALALVLATLVLGRFFCGWVCPLGTLVDVAHPIVGRKSRVGTRGRLRTVKYWLLAVILIWAALGVPIVGLFDPLSILVRGLALAVDPGLNLAVTEPFDWAYRYAPGWVTAISEPLYRLLGATVLPFRQTAFVLSLLAAAMLAAIFVLERVERRFWCRNLCPLGGLLALIARNAPLSWAPARACYANGCTTCADRCRMGAVDTPASAGEHEGLYSPEECNRCLDCSESCPRRVISFRFRSPLRRRQVPRSPLGVTRRMFLSALATGVALPAFFRSRGTAYGLPAARPDPSLIRPPGALAEADFLGRCVRCGECMKVCIGNGLQPALFQGGLEAAFSPVLMTRAGYCEFNCTLCGQVCPTGAIRRLDVVEKHKTVVGLAYFDKDRCLPYAKGTPCLVCEEHCPVPDKAIRLHEAVAIDQTGSEVTVAQPYMVDELCIGCGICEHKCPLPGDAGIHVTREGESREV